MTESLNQTIGHESKPEPHFTYEGRQHPKPSNLLLILLVLVLVSLVGFGGYYAGKYANKPATQYIAPSPLTQMHVSPMIDEMTGWKTYTNSAKNFSLKYPDDWQIENGSDPGVFAKIIKHLPPDSVDSSCKPGIGEGGTDCSPEVWIELETKAKPSNYVDVIQSSPCSIFGECLGGETEILPLGTTKAVLMYIRKDSYYPSFAYIDLPTEILKVRGYAPGSKNCVGTCPQYTDSELVIKSAKEIKQILSTFKFTN